MDTIDLSMNWQQALMPLLMVFRDADSHEGKEQAFQELRKMAFLADQFGKPLLIEVYAMTDRDGHYTIAARDDEIHSYDILVRCEGEDPIEEFEGLGEEMIYEISNMLEKKYPGASLVEVGG